MPLLHRPAYSGSARCTSSMDIDPMDTTRSTSLSAPCRQFLNPWFKWEWERLNATGSRSLAGVARVGSSLQTKPGSAGPVVRTATMSRSASFRSKPAVKTSPSSEWQRSAVNPSRFKGWKLTNSGINCVRALSGLYMASNAAARRTTPSEDV